MKLKTLLSCSCLLLILPYSPLTQAKSTFVNVETNLGTFVLELDEEKAPLTVNNFLTYLNEGFYKDTVFHRSIKGFVVQGGGIDRQRRQKTLHDPITNEANNGLKNVRGSVAMARTSDPNSATSGFYVNVADNVGLDYSASNPGYAVFGKVIAGMETIDTINNLPVAKDLSIDLGQGLENLPIADKDKKTIVYIVNIGEDKSPVSDPGSNHTVRAGTLVTLDGSGSHDPENASLTYDWASPAGVVLSDNHIAKPTFTVPAAGIGETLVFPLTVTDGRSSDTRSVTYTIAENSPPLVTVEPETIRENAEVTLQATASDPDGDALSYHWEQTAGMPVVLKDADTASPTFTAPWVGNTEELAFRLTVTDNYERNPQSTIRIAQVSINNDPTLLDCSRAVPSRKSIWPPTKGWIKVDIQGITSNNPYVVQITGVTSDEPVKESAAADTTAPDAKIRKGGSVVLRAERQIKNGLGNGRVYTVDFFASDGKQVCTGSVDVAVPFKRESTAVKDEQRYDATKKQSNVMPL